jgi:hypothetical protein
MNKMLGLLTSAVAWDKHVVRQARAIRNRCNSKEEIMQVLQGTPPAGPT